MFGYQIHCLLLVSMCQCCAIEQESSDPAWILLVVSEFDYAATIPSHEAIQHNILVHTIQAHLHFNHRILPADSFSNLPIMESREKLQELVRATGNSAAAWMKLLRWDYAVARQRGSEADLRKVLRAYRTALSQITTQERRGPDYMSILIDEARCQM